VPPLAQEILSSITNKVVKTAKARQMV